MKLILTRADLLAALQPAARVIESRNTIPILGNLKLAATADGRLAVTGTDLDIEMETGCAAQVDRPGALTAPGARLVDIVRKLPAEAQVSLAQEPGESAMKLTAGRSRFTLQTLPESDFPDIPSGEFPHAFALPAPDLARMIAATSFAISTEETRYYLNGIYLHTVEAEGGLRLTAVATDGHRLARFRTPAPAGCAGMPAVIVPRKTVGEIARLLDKEKDEVALSLSGQKIRVEIGGARLTSKLIDGTYPDYQRVIPQANDKVATFGAQELARAADRVATISGERGRSVKLALDDGRLTLSVSNPDAGSATEEVECEWDAGPFEIGFQARYLAEILATLGGDTVEARLADPGSPSVWAKPGDAELLTVLMPMRV